MRKTLVIILIILGLITVGLLTYTYVVPKLNGENRRIDAWISESGLNKYGDPENTAYSGGTPLFNEMTGERTDRYEYIKKMHPDKPWEK